MTPTLGLDDAAKLLRVHKNTLRCLAKTGEAPGAKIGRDWVFIEADLLAYMRTKYAVKVITPCRSTNKKAAKSGGLICATLGIGYAAQLDTLIALRPKKSTTRSR